MAGAPNITASTTDAQILRFATDSGQTSAEIIRIERNLRRLRNLARQAANDVRRANTGRGSRTVAQRSALQAGSMARGNFTLSGGLMRGAGGALIFVTAASAGVEAIGNAFERYQEDKKKMGGREAATRTFSHLNREVFGKPLDWVWQLGGGLADKIAKMVWGQQAADRYSVAAQNMWERLRFATGAWSTTEWEEKQAKRRAEQRAWQDREFDFLLNWRPEKAQVRNAEQLSAIQAWLLSMNTGQITQDMARFQANQFRDARAGNGED